MNLKKLLRAIFKPLRQLLAKIQGSKNPHQDLAKTCKLLQQQIIAPANHNKAWENYAKSLLLAKQCDGDELNQVIGQFDGAFNDRMLHSNMVGTEILSIPLQGGISGAPIFNQFGLLTFSQDHGGSRSFYSIPVELLRRLRSEL